MASLLRVPEVATGDTEAVLTEWSVAAGEEFDADAPLATVETAKAAAEVPAERPGVLLHQLVVAGAQVEVGQPIAVLAERGEVIDDLAATLAELGVGPQESSHAPDEDPALAQEPEEAAAPRTEVWASVPAGAQAAAREPGRERIFISPLARRLARENGLDPRDIVGSGPRGRVMRRDVEEAARARVSAGSTPVVTPVAVPTPTSAPLLEAQPSAPYVDVPHTRLRRAIARRLTESVQLAPQFTVSGRPSVERLLDLRRQLIETTGVRVSLNDLLMKAAACAHRAVPDMNVIWTEDAVRRFGSVDIALAVATERGLVTPVVRDVDRIGVLEIARRSAELVERARTSALRQSDLEGGTLSISNLGMFGTRSFTAIVNPPQAGILAVGAALPEPVAREGRVEVERVVHLTLSVDHRPVDGAIAAQWMQELVDVLEQPLRLLV
jgi:pyruvate dehydrogenase E2 component (dihydrolipoamide acetyltransferase)